MGLVKVMKSFLFGKKEGGSPEAIVDKSKKKTKFWKKTKKPFVSEGLADNVDPKTTPSTDAITETTPLPDSTTEKTPLTDTITDNVDQKTSPLPDTITDKVETKTTPLIDAITETTPLPDSTTEKTPLTDTITDNVDQKTTLLTDTIADNVDPKTTPLTEEEKNGIPEPIDQLKAELDQTRSLLKIAEAELTEAREESKWFETLFVRKQNRLLEMEMAMKDKDCKLRKLRRRVNDLEKVGKNETGTTVVVTTTVEVKSPSKESKNRETVGSNCSDKVDKKRSIPSSTFNSVPHKPEVKPKNESTKKKKTAIDKVPESPDEQMPLPDSNQEPKTESKWQKCKQWMRKTYDWSNRTGFTWFALTAVLGVGSFFLIGFPAFIFPVVGFVHFATQFLLNHYWPKN